MRSQEMKDKNNELNQQLLTDQSRSTRSTLNNHDPNENNQKPKAENAKRTFRRLLGYSFMFPGWMVAANLGLLVSSLGNVAIPLLCGQIIDHIKEKEDLLQDCIKFIILTVILAASSSIRGYGFSILGEKIVLEIRKQLFEKLVSKDISFYDKNKTGELISRLASDVTVIESAATDNLSILLRNIIQFFGSLIFLWVISWKLTLMIIVMTPIVSVCILFCIKAMKKLSKEYQNNLAFANSLANQVFGNIRVVKSFSNEVNENSNYQLLLQKTYQTGRKKSLFYALMLLLVTIFANVLILSVLYFGGKLTIDGEITIGNLASYILYALTLTIGFASVSGIINQIVSALGVSENIFKIMDEPVEVVGPKQPTVVNQDSDTAVKFSAATFCYPSKPNVEVLKGLDLSIRKGESVAIVGSSGSGKSSIVNLILRFYDLNSGQINFYGTNIKDININNLRRTIGVVSQQPTLFSGSLRENIEYGLDDSEKSEEKLMQALDIANAKFTLNEETFPDKLDTLVGERGIKLSGGQKQRIAIARSVIKKPSLLVFDEATSALDAESEALVQTAIDKIVEGRDKTMIIVAHRLSTIINCDRIVVLKDGLIIEEGNHEMLLKLNGAYANLVNKQLSSLSTQ